MASLAFIVSGVLHIQTHWSWYKSLINKGLGKKSKTTAWLSLIFAIATITGTVLLGVSGASTGVGLWHYRIGIILTILSAVHLIKRLPILKNK